MRSGHVCSAGTLAFPCRQKLEVKTPPHAVSKRLCATQLRTKWDHGHRLVELFLMSPSQNPHQKIVGLVVSRKGVREDAGTRCFHLSEEFIANGGIDVIMPLCRRIWSALASSVQVSNRRALHEKPVRKCAKTTTS